MNANRFLAGLAGLLVAAASLAWWSSDERAAGFAAREAGSDAAVEHASLVKLVEAPAEFAEMAARKATVERQAVDASPALAEEARAERATLVVTLVARETGAPLEEQQCSVTEAGAQSWSLLTVDSAEGELYQTLRSGADGIVRFHVPPGSYVVRPATRGSEPAAVDDLGAGETRALTIALRTSCDATAYVHVVDAQDGAPLPEVELTLIDVPAEAADATRRARTDADGRASFRIVSWLDAHGEMDPTGYNPVRFTLGDEHASPETALELRVRRSATLRGRVVEAAGAALPHMGVVLECDAWRLIADDTVGAGLVGLNIRLANGAQRRWTAKTGANGEFELTELPSCVPLDLSLERGSDVLHQEPVRLEPGEVREVAFKIGAGATVRGFLLDADGAPCPRIKLWLIRGATARMLEARDGPEDETRTADDGSFELADVRPGDWLLGPSQQSFQAKWLTHLEVPENVPVINIVLRLPRLLAVSGHTVDSAGEPVANVSINAYAEGVSARTKSGAEGAFRFDALPEGNVTIDAGHGDGKLRGAEPVQARAGDTDVVVVLVAGAEILVQVRDEAGQPIRAEVQTTQVELGSSWFTHTDGEGVGKLGRLPAGLFGVIARAKSGLVGTAGPVRLATGSHTELQVVARAGGRLRVHTRPFGGALVSVIQEGMIIEVLRAANGDVATTRPLPPGAVTVEILTEDESKTSREATVIAGETVDVAFG